MCVCVCVCVYIYIYIYIYIYTHTHTHIYIHTHIYALSVHLIIPLFLIPLLDYFLQLQNIYWNNSNYINHKHFANVKGTIYGNRLPNGTRVKKRKRSGTCGVADNDDKDNGRWGNVPSHDTAISTVKMSTRLHTTPIRMCRGVEVGHCALSNSALGKWSAVSHGRFIPRK